MSHERAAPLRRLLVASATSAGMHALVLVILGLLAADAVPDFAAQAPPLEVSVSPEESLQRTNAQRIELQLIKNVVRRPDPYRPTTGAIGLFAAAEPVRVEIHPGALPGAGSAQRADPQASGSSSGAGETGLGSGTGAPGGSGDVATFFGIQATGKRFAFVVDTSGSMNRNHRYLRCRRELGEALGRLKPDQRYFVVFFNARPFPMPERTALEATEANRAQTLKWFNGVVPAGTTDPYQALDMVLDDSPDAVFLLTDGSFSNGALAGILALQKDAAKKVPIHTIAFESREGERVLQYLAHATGGTYRFVP